MQGRWRVGVFHDDHLSPEVSLDVFVERGDNAVVQCIFDLGFAGVVSIRWAVGDKRRVQNYKSRMRNVSIEAVLPQRESESGMQHGTHSFSVRRAELITRNDVLFTAVIACGGRLRTAPRL